MLRGKPVLVHGDGTSLWTVTHASDFAWPFARLLGEPLALNEIFHITADRSWTWNEIFQSIASAIDRPDAEFVHIASQTLVQYNPDWAGPLLGDKSASVIFDNTKVKRIVGNFQCSEPWTGMSMVARRFPPRADNFDPAIDALYDRIIADQRALGR
jgi:nucleoside-diphosphate-sugar epimerase